MIAERIRALRLQSGMTQAELARRMGITRSGINAWEMGISTPSTQCIVELAELFHVSTDHLLGVSEEQVIHIDGFSEEQRKLLFSLVRYFEQENR